MFNANVSVVLAFVVCSVTAAAADTELVPLTADYHVHQARPLVGGNVIEKDEISKFSRDAQGRTRLEQGPFVTITDPNARTMYVLDTRNNTGRRVSIPRVARNAAGQATNVQGFSERELAGAQMIEGFQTSGRRYTATVPAQAMGNREPVEHQVEVWTSPELKAPLRITISDPVNGTTTQTYEHIRHGIALDPALFQAPPGYAISDATARVK